MRDLSLPSVGEAAARGLAGRPKSLPPYLLYDARGSELFEEITELPEYYLSRAESSIFKEHADTIVADAAKFAGSRLDLLELGAGTAVKTQILIRAAVRRQKGCSYFPADVSRTPLDQAVERLEREEANVHVVPLNTTHEMALAMSSERGGEEALLVLFLGSSIGNYEHADAARLLKAVRAAIGRRGSLLLGTDRVKSRDVLLRAYDDSRGVTAAFNKNVLSRLNRELAANFEIDRFRHVAVWNEIESRIEMYLESVVEQTVHIDALRMAVHFEARERIHTESCHKYDDSRIDRLLRHAGLARARTYLDHDGLFATHLVVGAANDAPDPLVS